MTQMCDNGVAEAIEYRGRSVFEPSTTIAYCGQNALHERTYVLADRLSNDGGSHGGRFAFMDNSYVIYLLWDPRNGDVRYVGQTKYPERRLADHRRGLLKRGHCRCWERLLIEQGLCCETAIVEEALTDIEANDRERWWIAYARQLAWPLTNATDGGDGSPGHMCSQETRDRMSHAQKGHSVSSEQRVKLRLAGLGHVVSVETRRKMSEAGRGRKLSPESVEKNRQAHLGKCPHAFSIESRKKMSAAARRRQISPETREKMRQSGLMRWARRNGKEASNDGKNDT